MNATYERVLKAIHDKPETQRELARKVLIWTAYARKPLPIDALTSAISIERGTKSLKDLERPTENYILDACANLVSVDQSSPRCVQFVHVSVQQFLIGHESKTLRMGREVAHREIAQTCMLSLTLFPTQIDFLGTYALDEWPHHLLAGKLNSLPDDGQMVALTLSFFSTTPMVSTEQPPRLETPQDSIKVYFKFSPKVLALMFGVPGTNTLPEWKELKEEQQEAPEPKYMILSDDKLAMHYATAELDSVLVAQRLQDNAYTVDHSYCRSDGGAPDWLQLSPLYSVQSTKMASFLLDNGASTEPQYLRSTPIDPLEYFAKRGSLGVEVLRLLLNRIKVLDQNEERFRRALQAAVWVGNLEAIRLLLGKGVNVNIQGGEYGNALQTAVLRGNVEVISLLLGGGADVNIQGGEFGNALQAAAWVGNLDLIRLLLDKGANINIQGGQYGNALQAAAWKGNMEVIRLLLDHGTDVNIGGGKYGNALHVAAWRGKAEVVQMLLDKGADFDILGGEYGSALQAAIRGRSVEVIQLLLDKGVDINIQGGEFDNALQAAACDGNIKVIELLLDKRADINIQGGKYGSTLQGAVRWTRNVGVIQLLLDEGADVNIEGGEYGSALQAAVCVGNLRFIRLLLQNGADVNMQGGKYGNALQAAAWVGNVEAIQLLLDKGADINIQGGQYGNALQAAAWRGNVEVTQILLNKGANINIRGGKYGSALQAAKCGDNPEVIQLLLDRGAEAESGKDASKKNSTGVLVHLWRLLGFTFFLVYLLYIFIGFWTLDD